jgi:putative sigma-54 modulation protein
MPGAFIWEKNSAYEERLPMQLNITARHLKLTPAIREYVEKKLEKANRFLDHLIWAQVVLDVSKRRHTAEIIIHAAGHTFTSQEESIDLYAAIDLASDTLDEQLRRYKERHRERRPENPRRTGRSKTWESESDVSLAEPINPRVSSTRVLRLEPLSVNEAITAMEESDSAHWIFLNRENRRVMVLYRKPDKTFGVVESIS